MKFFSSLFLRLKEVFALEALSELLARFALNLIVGFFVFLAIYLCWRVVRLVLKPALARSKVDETTSSFILTIVRYGFLIVGVVTALDSAGVNMAAMLTSLGIAGLTIGFAARDALSNVISGILIFLDRPFVIGDLVELEGYYGRVEKITMRSTRIITSDGKMLAVPNTEIINKTVASYTNFPNLRLDIKVTIAVTEDIERARKVLMELVGKNDDYLQNPPPRVVITQLNDYNLALELQVWLKDEQQHIAKRLELRETAFLALRESGVEMPYETIQIAPLEIKGNLSGG